MLWALEGLEMLHWGTHHGAGRLAGSRLASSYAWDTDDDDALSLFCGVSSFWGVCRVLLGDGRFSLP